MSRFLLVYVDDATEARLVKIAAELDRDITELAETSVSEAALDHFRLRDRAEDPGRGETLQRARAS